MMKVQLVQLGWLVGWGKLGEGLESGKTSPTCPNAMFNNPKSDENLNWDDVDDDNRYAGDDGGREGDGDDDSVNGRRGDNWAVNWAKNDIGHHLLRNYWLKLQKLDIWPLKPPTRVTEESFNSIDSPEVQKKYKKWYAIDALGSISKYL